MLVRQAPACSGRPVDAQGYLLGNGPSLGNSACAPWGSHICSGYRSNYPVFFLYSQVCHLWLGRPRHAKWSRITGGNRSHCTNSAIWGSCATTQKDNTPYTKLHKAPFSAEQEPKREGRETIAEHKSCVARKLPRHPPRGTSAVIGPAQQPRPPGRTLALRFTTGNDSVGSYAACKTRAAGYPRVSRRLFLAFSHVYASSLGVWWFI